MEWKYENEKIGKNHRICTDIHTSVDIPASDRGNKSCSWRCCFKQNGDITSDIYGDVDGTVLTKTLEEAFEEGYQKRLKEEEERLNEIILEKENGNRKLIYYFEPVKYFDEDGNVKDKSYDISRLPNGSLQTAASDIITTFPDKFSDGISLKNRDVSLTLSPLNAYPSNAALSSDKKTVTYEIDSHTRYDYSLTLMGFKEDIVVEEYTGQTEYSFVLETGGLSLVFDGGWAKQRYGRA